MASQPLARAPSAPLVPPALAEIEAFRQLAVAGRILDVHRRMGRFAPVEEWREPSAARTAAWICVSLGAPKRARAVSLRAVRRVPRATASRLLRLGIVLETRGPLAAWEALRREAPFGADAEAEDRADLKLLEAGILASFHDFEAAHLALDGVAALGTSRRRLELARARTLAAADRYEEALAAAERGRAIAPLSPDAIGTTAHLRLLVGDDAGALDLLRAGAQESQSPEVALQLVRVLEERKLHDERADWIERWAERVPLLEDVGQLAAMRADCAFDRGRFSEALRLSRESRAPFHLTVAEHLARALEGGPAKHATLDVPFVRQHDMTCVPATLTMLARYWGVPASHVEVADAICYDGTPHHSQRTWAETHGFVVRELTATWGSLRALLDRGIPVAVATAAADRGHLQAVVGYDERRGTISIRDPFIPTVLEAVAEPWLAHWRGGGLHASAIVPVAEAARLDGLDLPDAPLCDAVHEVNAALARHDRETAGAAADRLAREAPGHRLSIAARRAVAAYDQDFEGVLACAREAAAADPRLVFARLDALACMRVVRPRSERIAEAEALLESQPHEPLYGEALARELCDDAREHPRAARHLRRSLRARHDRYPAIAMLADVSWSRADFEEALALRRLAACVGRYDDAAAYAYFLGARALGREGEALATLSAREERLGARGAGPAKTLFVALESLGRSDEARRRLDAALERRRGDGSLVLAAAEAHGAAGEIDVARQLLARAEPLSKRADWLRTASVLALRTGDLSGRRRSLEEHLALEPLDVNAHAAYAQMIAGLEGATAARAYVESAWTKSPHLRSLARLMVQWFDGAGPREVERTARAVIAVDGADAWTHRQLALALLEQGRLDEAEGALRDAASLVPRDASLQSVRAELARRRGDRASARAALLAAIEIDPDRSDAIRSLVLTAERVEERDDVLDAVERIVCQRSVTGAGILSWYLVARSIRDPEPLGTSVDRLHAERESLWATWSCAVRHRSFVGDHASAVALARRACERFPGVAGAWVDHADALGAAGKAGLAIAPLERAVLLGPEDETTPSRLAGALLRVGDAGRANEVLRQAIARLPASAPLKVHRAALRWGQGGRAEAMGELEAALALEPRSDEAWRLLDEWSLEAGSGSTVLSRIESVCAERPFSAHAALSLARANGRRGDYARALEALARAHDADPFFSDAYDLQAVVLAGLGRYDEAGAACDPPAFEGRPPRELRGRAAWVRARRGDLGGATRALRAIVEEHPDYVWGWAQIAAWSAARGDPAEGLEAARQLVRASPRLAAGHADLADALFATGAREDGKRALARAVDLDPSNEELAQRLFDASLEDADVAAAEALVPVLRAARSAAGTSAQARICARTGDAEGGHRRSA